MQLIKKIVAIMLVTIMCLGLLASCANTDNVMEIQGEQIPAGLYIIYQSMAISDAQSKDEYDSSLDNIWDNTIEGVAMADWVNQRAIEYAKENIVVDNLLQELGLTITAEDQAEIDYNYEQTWATYQEQYEAIGIGATSFKKYLEINAKYTKVFETYYDAEIGVEPISDADLMTHFKSEFAQFKAISFYTFDSETYETLDEAGLAEVKARAEEYLELAKAEGADFEKLIQQKQIEDAKASESEEPTFADDADSTYTLKKGATSYYFPETVLTAIFEDVAIGETTIIESDDAIYVVQKYDPEDNKEYFSEMREQLFYDLKQDDFDNMLAEKAIEIEATLNDAAIKRYSPKKLA